MRPIQIIVFIPLIVFIFSCQKKTEQPVSPVEVTTYLVEPQTIPVDFSFIGVVQSSHEVHILSAVQGELKKIAYIEGSFVQQGDLLFQIDPRRYLALVKEAESSLEAEQAALSDAEETVNRLIPLYTQKAVSKKDLDDAKSQLLTSQASVNKFQAKLDEANLDLSNTFITAPISGFTSAVQSQEGTLIVPNINGNLATVSALDPIFVEITSSEGLYLTNLEEVKKGELILPPNDAFDVTLKLSNGSLFPCRGKISFVSPIFNASTGTLTTRAVFPNPGNLLKPGLFVNATVHGAYRPNAIIIPQEAVQQGQAGYFVYIVDADRKAEIRPVVVGDWYKEYWIVKSGLKKGDRVIVTGTMKLKNGTPVQIKKS